MAKNNILLDYMKNKETQSSQAASTSIGRSIDSQQAAWDQTLKDQPSTFKLWNPDTPDTSTQQKTNPLLSFTDEWEKKQETKKQQAQADTSEYVNRYFRDMMSGKSYNDIVMGGGTWNGLQFEDSPYTKWVRENFGAENGDASYGGKPDKPAETPKVEEPKAPEKKQLEYNDAFLKQEDQKDAWSPTWENGKSIKQIEAEASPKEETDYSKQNIIQKAWTIAKSIDRQAGNNFLSNISGAASSMLGEGTFANELWTIIGSTLNSFGADIDVNKNPVSEWRESRTERQQYDASQYAEMFKDDPVAQTISKYGTMVASQVPSAMLSIMTAMTAAPLTATTESLNYISALNNSKGFTQLATMATEGLKKVAGDPQFWMSYSQESGSAYNDAIADGATPEMASLYSSVYGTLSAMIEVGGADEALGGAQNFPKEAADAYRAGDIGRASWEFVKSIFGEIGEEEQQEALGAYLKQMYKDVPLYSDNEWTINMDGSTVPTPEGVADNDAVINFDRMIDTAFDTAISTALLVGGESAITKTLTASDTKQAKEAASNALLAGLEGELVNKGLDVDTATEVANILAKSAQGKTLTKKEKNILMEIRNREDVAAGSNEAGNALTESLEAQEEVSPTATQPAPQETTGTNPAKAAQLETMLDTAQENQATAGTETPAPVENPGEPVGKRARLETELDTASENSVPPAPLEYEGGSSDDVMNNVAAAIEAGNSVQDAIQPFISMIKNMTDEALRKFKMTGLHDYISESYASLEHEGAARQAESALADAVTEELNSREGAVIENGRSYTPQQMLQIFNKANKVPALTDLAKKVFAVAEKLGIVGEATTETPYVGVYDDMHRSPTSVSINPNIMNGLTDAGRAQTILHEYIHGVTSYIMTEVNKYSALFNGDAENAPDWYKNNVTPEMEQAVKTIFDVYTQLSNDPTFRPHESGTFSLEPTERDTGHFYAAENAYEMIAELSDPNFRSYLQTKNLWQTIVDAIKKLFGISGNNALDDLSSSLDYILSNASTEAFNQYGTDITQSDFEKAAHTTTDVTENPLVESAENNTSPVQTEQNENPLLTATGVTPETQTNRGVNPNKAAQVQTELDKRTERIAEIQQEIADLEQQVPSAERNEAILRLVEEQNNLTQENAAEEQSAPATEETETIETAPATTETTQTNEISPNKAARIETELDKNAKRLAEIEQELDELEQQPESEETDDKLVQLMTEKMLLEADARTASTASEESSENAVETQEEAEGTETPAEQEQELNSNLEQNTAEEQQTAQETAEEEYNALGEKYGTMEPGEKAARDAAMPKQTSDDTRNSESARTVAESPNTPEERLPDVKSAVVEGKTSYTPTTNAELAQEAESKIEEEGWEKSLRDWTAAVRSGQANAQLVAEGAVLLNNAANNPNCTGAEYIDIMLDYVALNHALGRGLAANRILKTLSPEGRLYALQKIVQKMSNDAKDSKKNQRQRARQEKANQQAAEELVEEVRRDMSNLVFTFEYSDEAAQIVANAVARKANPQARTSTPTSLEQLAKTIAKFAAERIQTKKNASNSMTATQILAELSNNEEFAREVYELAQQQTRNTPNADAFSNESMNLADSRIVQRALAETALNTNENNETIRNQAALGMSNDQIADYLAGYLIEAVNASESMSNAIHDAALNYVTNVLNNDTKTEEARVNTLVNQIMNQIGEQFYNLAKSDTYTRDTTRQAIVDTLTERYGIDGSSANAVADAIAADFDTKLQNAIQDQLQKRFGDKVKSDKAAVQTANKLTEAVNLGAFDSEYASRAINKLFGVDGEYTLDPDLVEEYRNQTTDEGRDKVLEKMQQDIADQVPATLKDKFTALRYLNMLGNLKTQVRNILGNVGNMAMYKAKNTVRSAIENLLGTDKQYSAFYGADLRRVSSQYFDNNSDVQKEAMGSNKFASVSKQYRQEIEDKRRIFKSNILEGYRHLTDKMMNEIGDKIFVKATFTDALAGYLKAHDITAEQWNALVTEANGDPSSEAADIVDKATAFAVKQAQEATFRDTNAVSKAFSEFDSNWPNLLKTLSQGVIPFRKTPANVLVRMEEFSPLGFANTAFKAIQKKMGSENVTGADIIDSFSKALTGTGLAAIGYFLAAAGKARTKSDDDKEEAYAKLMGLQDYSITVGGHNLTMDWMTPESASFFMGVELYNLLKDGTVPPEAAMRLLGNLTSPMLEMSMLSGLNDALDNIADYNGDTEALPQLVLNSAWGYLSQGITNTLLGQLEQGSEKYRQSYYTDPDNPFLTPAMQKMLAKAGNKTPGKDFQAADFIDAWGRKQENFSNPLARYAYALGSPSYISSLDKNATEVDAELQRLYEYGKDIDRFPTVFPQQTSRSTKVNGTRLSPEEYDLYATAKGQKSLELVSDLIKSDEYKNMTDDEKAAAVSDMYSYATQLAAEKVANSRKEDYDFSDNRYERMKSAEEEGISAAQYYGYYQKFRDLRDDKSLTAQQKAEKFATYVINQKGLSEPQKSLLRDSFKFTTTLVADTNSYDKWIAAGLSPEQAEGFNKKINADGSSSISNAERYAAIEQYATDAEMAEKLWEAMGSSTWTKSGKSYFKANPSSKFRNSWSGKTYSTPKSSSSSSSSSSSGNPLLKNWSGSSSSGTSSSPSSSGNILLNNWNRG